MGQSVSVAKDFFHEEKPKVEDTDEYEVQNKNKIQDKPKQIILDKENLNQFRQIKPDLTQIIKKSNSIKQQEPSINKILSQNIQQEQQDQVPTITGTTNDTTKQLKQSRISYADRINSTCIIFLPVTKIKVIIDQNQDFYRNDEII